MAKETAREERARRERRARQRSEAITRIVEQVQREIPTAGTGTLGGYLARSAAVSIEVERRRTALFG